LFEAFVKSPLNLPVLRDPAQFIRGFDGAIIALEYLPTRVVLASGHQQYLDMSYPQDGVPVGLPRGLDHRCEKKGNRLADIGAMQGPKSPS